MLRRVAFALYLSNVKCYSVRQRNPQQAFGPFRARVSHLGLVGPEVNFE